MTGGRQRILWLLLLVVLALFALSRLAGDDDDGDGDEDAGPSPTTQLPAPQGTVPADRIVFDSDRTGNFEVYSTAADGSDVQALTTDEAFDSWWARVSPDRQRILFYRTPKGVHDQDYGQTSLWMMNADGSSPVELRPAGTDGWDLQGHAEWSPDGQRLVMFGGPVRDPQLYVTSATGREPRAITERKGQHLDPSWSPDGGTIVFAGCAGTGCPPDQYEINTVPASGGEITRLTRDRLRDHDPVYSPDGRRLAWLTEITSKPPVWDIRTATALGRSPRRLVRDEAINSRPEWTKDGSRIYFHRLTPGEDRFQIFSVPADGGRVQPLTGEQPGVNEYPST